MPTFQSIGVHPELRSRLVTAEHSSSSTTSSSSSSLSRVLTPQALLSRPPEALHLLPVPVLEQTATISHGTNVTTTDNGNNDDNDNTTNATTKQSLSRPIPLPQAQRLRQEVALAMIQHSRAGKRLRRIQPHPTFPGTMSAMDWLRHHKHQATVTMEPKDCVPTAPALLTNCRALDDLLAVSLEYDIGHIATVTAATAATAATDTAWCSHDLLPAPLPRGLPFGYVTELAGPPGSGKTQLALQLAATTTTTTTTPTNSTLHECWYLHSSSCSAALLARRLVELCRSNSNIHSSTEHVDRNVEEAVASVLRRTHFAHVADEYQLLQQLAGLEARLGQHYEYWCPVLLVVDSCSGCLSSTHNNDGLLLVVAKTIQRMTRQYRLATVLINGTVADRSAPHNRNSYNPRPCHHHRLVKAALGRAWRAVADIAVWVDHHEEHRIGKEHQWCDNDVDGDTTTVPVFCATVEKHVAQHAGCDSDGASGNAALFVITATGIHDVLDHYSIRRNIV